MIYAKHYQATGTHTEREERYQNARRWHIIIISLLCAAERQKYVCFTPLSHSGAVYAERPQKRNCANAGVFTGAANWFTPCPEGTSCVQTLICPNWIGIDEISLRTWWRLKFMLLLPNGNMFFTELASSWKEICWQAGLQLLSWSWVSSPEAHLPFSTQEVVLSPVSFWMFGALEIKETPASFVFAHMFQFKTQWKGSLVTCFFQNPNQPFPRNHFIGWPGPRSGHVCACFHCEISLTASNSSS